MRICLIFNEVAGRRRTARRLRGFLARHRRQVELWPTQYAGHAMELAREGVPVDRVLPLYRKVWEGQERGGYRVERTPMICEILAAKNTPLRSTPTSTP